MYPDGAGLYLQVTGSAGRSWIFRYMPPGHKSTRGKPLSRTMGLGSAAVVTLAAARMLADAARKQLAQGIDPIEARQAAERAARTEVARTLTFREAAEAYIAVNRSV